MKIDLEEVEKAGLTLEETMILVEIEYIRAGKVVPYTTDVKLYVKLVEDGLIGVTTSGYSITTEGYQIFRAITGKKLLPIKGSTGNFAEFWAAFPSSDAHGNWRKTRSLKDDKKGSEVIYKRIIKNKESTQEDILRALKLELDERKSNSQLNNRMTFMKNSKTWLRTKQFQITLEEQNNENEESFDGGWTDELV